jgi:probable F420-dependent oxidoreductase
VRRIKRLVTGLRAIIESMSSRPIRIGVQFGQYGTSWSSILAVAQEAEELGADLLFNWDHFFGPGPDSEESHLECWTVLAAWAACTSRIGLGPLVSAIGYRNPDLVADMARTVDHISGGRFVLGMGAGFKLRDYVEYGYSMGSPAARITELDEGLDRIRRRLALLNPPPVRPLPILVAGSGEQRTLRVVAKHADIWHTFADGEDFARKTTLLDRYCEDLGRNPQDIERAVLVRGDPHLQGDSLRELGATLFVVSLTERPRPNLQELTPWLTWRDQHN